MSLRPVFDKTNEIFKFFFDSETIFDICDEKIDEHKEQVDQNGDKEHCIQDDDPGVQRVIFIILKRSKQQLF